MLDVAQAREVELARALRVVAPRVVDVDRVQPRVRHLRDAVAPERARGQAEVVQRARADDHPPPVDAQAVAVERDPHALLVRREPAFRVERGHAAGARRRHRLAVDGIHRVAAGEHALDVRARRAGLRSRGSPAGSGRARRETDRCWACGRSRRTARRPRAASTRAACAGRARARRSRALSSPSTSATSECHTKRIFVVVLRALGHDLARAQLAAAVDHVHLTREAGQEERLLHRRVAAADDRHRAARGRARRRRSRTPRRRGSRTSPRTAMPEPLRLRAGRDDHRVGLDASRLRLDRERPRARSRSRSRPRRRSRAPKRSACLLEQLHQLRARRRPRGSRGSSRPRW